MFYKNLSKLLKIKNDVMNIYATILRITILKSVERPHKIESRWKRSKYLH